MLRKLAIIFIGVIFFFGGMLVYQVLNDEQETPQIALPTPDAHIAFPDDLDLQGNLTVNGTTELNGEVVFTDSKFEINSGVLSIDSDGKLVLVEDKQGITQVVYQSDLPQGKDNSFLYYDDNDWVTSDLLFQNNNLLGIDNINPQAKLHIKTAHSEAIGLIIEAEQNQIANLQEWRNSSGNVMAKITNNGKLVLDNNADHQIELRPSGDTGHLSSSGGALFIENTHNIGTGIGIYSNAGGEAEGNMINVKVDNPLYNQAAFYMNYDGLSNAVEIVSNTNDDSSNALSITNFNQLDSALGVIGYETGRGTIKVTHNGTGNDANASGISIDLKGTGTRAQGLYIDSTATGGTLGNLLRLRNQTIDRFVVDYTGSLKVGANGTNTSITKYGNTVGDEFFVGTNGAFRIQRSATDSEAFRTQVVGDIHGRWLGTSDGKLKFGPGNSIQDVVLERTDVGLMRLSGDLVIVSQGTNNDVLTVNASDGSRLSRLTETSGGHGWFEIDDSTGAARILFRADGGASYINSGNFGIGTTSFGTGASKVLALGNATGPSTSIADGVQLWAEDVAGSSELRVRDEAGTTTTLSPHNFSLIPDGASEDLAWSFYAEKDDKAVNADMTKALRLLENLTGEQLIYIKDLKTNQYIGNLQSQTDNEKLGEDISQKIHELNVKEQLASHMSFGENVLTFITEVIYKVKTIFEAPVEFMASATFKGPVKVNANTAGELNIPSGTSKFKIKFSEPFEYKPVVQVTLSDSSVEYKVVNLTESGFEIHLSQVLNTDIQVQWQALLSDNDNSSQLEIIE